MAAVHEQFLVEAPAHLVWTAVRDVGAEDRVFRGVLGRSQRTEDGRVVTFADGAVVREVVVDLDDERRRLAYTAVEGPLRAAHHHSIMQVLEAGDGRSRVLWSTDVLPDELAMPVAALMRRGAAAMQDTLRRR